MSLKRDATYKVVEHCLRLLQDKAPINIQFLTEPISSTVTARIKALEEVYGNSKIYRLLLKTGIYPIVLFTAVSGGLGYGLQKTYSRYTKLSLNLLGVVYPTWRCWRILKETSTSEQELKSWLTYWLIFGSFQGKPRSRKCSRLIFLIFCVV